MPDRAERRRQQRAKAKQPVIIAGDGIVATELVKNGTDTQEEAL